MNLEDIKNAKNTRELAKAVKGLEGLAPEKETSAKAAGTFGAWAVANLKGLGELRSKTNSSVSTEFGYKAATDYHGTIQDIVTDKTVIDVQQPKLTIRGLFGAQTISGNALRYMVLNATEGAAGVVAEGAKYAQIHVPNETKDMSLSKIGAIFKETDELLEDAAYLESAINSRGIYEHNLAVEKWIAAQLLGTSGIQTTAFKDTMADTIFTAMTNVQTATGYDADAIVMNPADYQTLRLTKDSNGQYLGGGFFYGAYGNGGIQAQPNLWGLPTVVSQSVAKGTAVVGAFKAAASVVTKAGSGLRVEVCTSDGEDFTKGIVTVRIDERLGLAVRVPAAFAKVTLTA